MNQEPCKNLLLIDINSHLSRAYHSCVSRELNILEGSYYGGNARFMINPAINLIQNEIKKLEKRGIKADYICLVMDASGKNFRHDLYPQYKANRPERDADYISQREEILDILAYKGYSIIRENGVEADDVITTITKKANKVANLNTYVLTDDKDMFYLINEKTFLFRGKIDKMYDRQACIDEKGVPPEKMVDFLTLDGDKADNIIGIPRLGEKTIPRILKKYSIDQIIENPELLKDQDLKVSGSAGIIKYLKENKEFVKLMKKIVEMKEDLVLGVSLKHFKMKYQNEDGLINKGKKLGMKL
jgi:DNA polymerase-1